MAKILICGGKGQLGTELNRVLPSAHTILSHDLDTLDITRKEDVAAVVASFSPDVLINCAAYTQVDACESEAETARRINAEGPGILGRCMASGRGSILHISTDYVFDGNKPVPFPYVETDATEPLSAYGRTKLDGETAVAGATDRHAIVRTAWLYGASGKNFLKSILKLALMHPNRALPVVDDQYGSPTWAFRLAQQIEKILQIEGRGVYHATAEGYCTWYALAVHFLDRLAVPHNLTPCTTAAFPRPAARPKNAILENSRLKAAGAHLMEDWKKDVDRFVEKHGDALCKEAKQEVSA